MSDKLCHLYHWGAILNDTKKRPCSWQALAVPWTTTPATENLNMPTSVTLSIFTSLGNILDSASNKIETLDIKQQFLKTNKQTNKEIIPLSPSFPSSGDHNSFRLYGSEHYKYLLIQTHLVFIPG